MKTRGWTMALLVLLASAAQAQNPAPRNQRPRQRPPMAMPPADSAGQMMAPGMGPGPDGPDQMGPRREMLRQRIEERFGQIVQNQLSLNDQQMQQLRTAMRANQDRKRDILRRQQDVQRAIQGQMQPGQAANADSLNRLLNAAGQMHVDMAQSDQQFQRDLAFLTPVQRARLMMMMQRMEQQMRDIVQQRKMRDAPMRRGP